MQTGLLAIAFAMLCGILSSASGLAGSLVPYKGLVQGDLVVDLATGEVLSGEASQVASHLGVGTQSYGNVGLTVPGEGQLVLSGTAESVAANGDVLPLTYWLHGFYVSDTEILYAGTYTIQRGGTGRFDFPNNTDPDTAEIDLGTGTIIGQATVKFETGVLSLSFKHSFNGTLYSPGAGRKSNK